MSTAGAECVVDPEAKSARLCVCADVVERDAAEISTTARPPMYRHPLQRLQRESRLSSSKPRRARGQSFIEFRARAHLDLTGTPQSHGGLPTRANASGAGIWFVSLIQRMASYRPSDGSRRPRSSGRFLQQAGRRGLERVEHAAAGALHSSTNLRASSPRRSAPLQEIQRDAFALEQSPRAARTVASTVPLLTRSPTAQWRVKLSTPPARGVDERKQLNAGDDEA